MKFGHVTQLQPAVRLVAVFATVQENDDDDNPSVVTGVLPVVAVTAVPCNPTSVDEDAGFGPLLDYEVVVVWDGRLRELGNATNDCEHEVTVNELVACDWPAGEDEQRLQPYIDSVRVQALDRWHERHPHDNVIVVAD